MLHTKFPGNWFWRFLKGFNIYGHGGHLDHVTSIMSLDFNFLVPKSLHIKFGSKWHTSF